jgi:hypothetical protein
MRAAACASAAETPRHFVEIDRIPAVKKVRVRHVDAERYPQAGEIALNADLSGLVPQAREIRRESTAQKISENRPGLLITN